MPKYFKPEAGPNINIVRKNKAGMLLRDQLPTEGIYTEKEMAAIVEPKGIKGEWLTLGSDQVGYIFGLRQMLSPPKPTVPQLECCHADTCLPDYWAGHQNAHIQVPVWPRMKVLELRKALHSELNQGAVAGNDDRTRDDSGDIGDLWYKRAHAAVNRAMKGLGVRTLFKDLEPQTDDGESVYAFFVFRDRE